MAIIDIVKWDSTNPKLIAWKFPSDQLATWTQLVVNDSQQAWLVHEGVYEGPFEGGRHVLSTENLPFISKAIGLPFGGSSPFTSEVWFVNLAEILGLKWGTMAAMQLMDPLYGVLLPVRAFSQFGIRVVDGRVLLAKLVGTTDVFSADQFLDYFKGLIAARVKTAISEWIVKKKVPIFELSAHLTELSDYLPATINACFKDYGIELVRFDLMSVTVPEDDASVVELKKILAEQSRLRVLGMNYQQVRSFDVLDQAASNQGAAGGFMGIGIGSALGGHMVQGGGIASMGGLLNTAPAAQPARTGSDEEQKSAKNAEERFDAAAQRIKLLKELAELKSSGILSEEEFQKEKAKILE